MFVRAITMPALGLVLALLQVLPVSATPIRQNDEASPQQSPQSPSRIDPASLQALKAQIDAMKMEYEKRIKELEDQIQQLQVEMLKSAPEPEPTTQAAQPTGGRAVQSFPGVLNPAISVVANFMGRGDNGKIYNEEGARIDNKFNLREGEIDMRVPVDPYADGVLIAAIAADISGKYTIDLEEAYVNIKKLPFLDQMPLGLRFKVGRFRPAFGKINVLHTHDLPQSFRPLPIQEFLGNEGFNQSGVSSSFFIPTPWDKKSSVDATVEFLTGGGIAISPDQQARNATLGHLRWFRTFKDAHNVELGWSTYHHPQGNSIRSANLQGFDWMYRWKPFRQGEWKSFLLGGEAMFTNAPIPDAGEPVDVARAIQGLQPGHGKPYGFTMFGQWQLDRRKYVGVRFDQTTTLFDPGLKRKSVTPYLSYYFSEFLRLRLNYEQRWSDLFTEDGRKSVFFELNWVFGAHPSEPFWVNK